MHKPPPKLSLSPPPPSPATSRRAGRLTGSARRRRPVKKETESSHGLKESTPQLGKRAAPDGKTRFMLLSTQRSGTHAGMPRPGPENYWFTFMETLQRLNISLIHLCGATTSGPRVVRHRSSAVASMARGARVLMSHADPRRDQPLPPEPQGRQMPPPGRDEDAVCQGAQRHGEDALRGSGREAARAQITLEYEEATKDPANFAGLFVPDRRRRRRRSRTTPSSSTSDECRGSTTSGAGRDRERIARPWVEAKRRGVLRVTAR